jgi:hypothetical protein
MRPTATSHLLIVDDSAMPAAFVMLEALPADTPCTALLVTSHGTKSRPAPASAPATCLVWLDQPGMLEMLSDLHPATGTAAYLFGERHLVRTAEELLVAGGLDRDNMASKAYWRRDQPNASHSEPPFKLNFGSGERTPPVVASPRLRALLPFRETVVPHQVPAKTSARFCCAHLHGRVAFHQGFCGARWNRTIDLSIISAAL